jgi:hypothetical protein
MILFSTSVTGHEHRNQLRIWNYEARRKIYFPRMVTSTANMISFLVEACVSKYSTARPNCACNLLRDYSLWNGEKVVLQFLQVKKF